MKPPERFDTDRLLLRVPLLDDADDIFASYAADPEVTRFMPWPPHTAVEQSMTFVIRCHGNWQDDSEYTWAIVPRDTGQCSGMIALRVRGCKADFGYVLARSLWGRGMITEVAREIVAWAWAQPAIFRVWAVCDVENIASARVLEKLGLLREGVLRRWSINNVDSAAPRDHYCYAKVK